MARGQHAAMVIAAIAPIAVAAIGKIPDARPPAPPRTVTQVVVAQPGPPPSSAASAAPPAAATPAPAPEPAAAPGAIVSDMDPAACRALYPGIELPFHRGDEAAATQRIVCRQGYILSYNIATHSPDWVLERLTADKLRGGAKRKDNFREDPLLKSLDADDSDYLPRVYDRGHQAPAADAAWSQQVNNDSFFFSNMSPQVGIGFNRGIWRVLEETVRGWVLCGGHDPLYVITGPIYQGSTTVIGHDRMVVPHSFYKIVYDPAVERVVGFVLENRKIGSRFDTPQDYVRSVADIETETGIDFFRDWDFRKQRLLEAQPGTAWGRADHCSGSMGAD
jgi:endonuclease G, mitochondrial